MSNKKPMSKILNADPNPHPKSGTLTIQIGVPAAGVHAVLAVILCKNGEVKVAGPLQEPSLCKRLLDEAWATIIEYQAKQPSIIMAPPGLDV
jgi:hypothetical protein